MKHAVTMTLSAFALMFAAPSQAHLVRTPDMPGKNHLENRLAQQVENLEHARYVARRGAGKNRAWHRAWLPILRQEIRETRVALTPRPRTVPGIIRAVFGAHGSAAVAVASCETGGTFDVNATNGQYLGLFQMGDYARGRYGHGPDAWTQSRAAYAYFRDSGFDWSPWECKPW